MYWAGHFCWQRPHTAHTLRTFTAQKGCLFILCFGVRPDTAAWRAFGGEPYGGKLTSLAHTRVVPIWVVILHPISTPSPFFSLLFLTTSISTPCHVCPPNKDIIKLSFIGQCKRETLLVICIKPHKPHRCPPALWNLSSESLSWGQSHSTSSNSVSECQIELKLEASPLRRRAQSPHSEPRSKTHPHTYHSIALMFFKDGADEQKRDLLYPGVLGFK